MSDNPFGSPIDFGTFGLVDPLASKWANKPVSPPAVAESAGPDGARWLREGQQLVVSRDGMTGTISFLQAVDESGNLTSDVEAIPKVNSRWSDKQSDATYNLMCVSVKATPYAITQNGSERLLYTCEYSSQPLDPTEIDFGGDFISCKGGSTGKGFVWEDTKATVSQTLHKATLSVKFRITKRRSSLPYDDIIARLGCVNNDDFNVPNNQNGVSCTIKGTDGGDSPDDAFLLFEGCKAVETTDPNGGVMWKITYNFTAKYNRDASGAVVGWNDIFRDEDARFIRVIPYSQKDADMPTSLYKEMDLSMLIKPEEGT